MDPTIYLKDSLNIIAQSLRSIKSGQTFFYRVIALQLRLILCDTLRVHDEVIDISLIRRIDPDIQLHSITWDAETALHPKTLSLEDWLSTSIPGNENEPITIRKLIRQVCDTDGGAHVDQRANLIFPPDYLEWIIRLAGSVLSDLNKYQQ
jgi:hypothetical protein